MEALFDLVKVNAGLAVDNVGSEIRLRYIPDEGWRLEYMDGSSFAFSAEWRADTLEDLWREIRDNPEGNYEDISSEYEDEGKIS